MGVKWAASPASNIVESREATSASARESTGVTVHNFEVISNHPLVSVEGVFRNDPTWDDYMQSIAEYRREINALENSLE